MHLLLFGSRWQISLAWLPMIYKSYQSTINFSLYLNQKSSWSWLTNTWTNISLHFFLLLSLFLTQYLIIIQAESSVISSWCFCAAEVNFYFKRQPSTEIKLRILRIYGYPEQSVNQLEKYDIIFYIFYNVFVLCQLPFHQNHHKRLKWGSRMVKEDQSLTNLTPLITLLWSSVKGTCRKNIIVDE